DRGARAGGRRDRACLGDVRSAPGVGRRARRRVRGHRGAPGPVRGCVRRVGVHAPGAVADPAVGGFRQPGRGWRGQHARRDGGRHIGAAAAGPDRVRPLLRPVHVRRCGAARRRLLAGGDLIRMSSFPWLTVIGAIPLAGALVIAIIPVASSDDSASPGPATPPNAALAARDLVTKQIALLTSLVTLGMTIAMAVEFSPSGPAFQFVQVYQWIPQFGVHYAVGVDGIALVLIGMTAVLMPVVILASWHDADPGKHGESAPGPKRSVKTYFALMLVLETLVIGVFAATDVFMFYVFFEAMLVPMYFMIGSFGVGQRQYAAVKFLLYSLLGGLLMLVAVIALYVYSAQRGHPGTFLFSQLTHLVLSTEVERWLFLGFFVAFAIKAPLWPFHTWLPDAATSAQPGAAGVLGGGLDKVGTFGMIRLCLELFPSASRYFTPLILTLAVIGVLYGAVVAIGQADIKRLIAYTSISHFGLIALGIFVLTSQGQAGATLYMVNHGFATGALFLIAGVLIARRRSQRIAGYGRVQTVAPVLAGAVLRFPAV